MADISGPSDFNQKVIAEFRANGGKVGGPFEGSTLLLLHTIGAKSGLPRVNPVDCTVLDEDIVVYASAGGVPKCPAWFHNLVAHPDVQVELGAETIDVVARVTTGAERVELLERQKDRISGFVDDAETPREFHVVVLTRSP